MAGHKKGSLTLFTNRASALFKEAGDLVEPLIPRNQRYRFSYWATFFGENPDADINDIQLIESKVSNLVESKGWLAKAVVERSVELLFPRTCFSVEEALTYADQSPLWFSKPVHLSGGRDIECILSQDLVNYTLPKHHILQQGVQNLMLLDDRKFTARIYLLIWNGHLWLFDDGFIVLHGKPYEPNSNSYEIHVDHRGYEKTDSPIEMRLLSSLENFQEYWKVIGNSIMQMTPLFKEQLEASSKSRYLMLGIDFLLQRDGGIQYIEVNAIPNFVHTLYINKQLNIPFFTNSMQLMLGLNSPRLLLLTSK